MATDTTPPGLLSVLRLAISDPGSVLPPKAYDMYGDGCPRRETLSDWQARAAAEAVRPFLAELSESERFQVGEAWRMLAAFAADRLGDGIYSSERTLHDHARNLLDLVDRIAPEAALGQRDGKAVQR